MKSDLPLAADDGWDMSPRRETAVMVDIPTSFEPLAPDRPLPTARGVLSPAEIEALLRPDLSDMPAAAPPEPERVEDKPLPDVEAPMAPTKVEAPLTDIPDTARRLASRLSLALRKGCGLRAAATARAMTEGDFETGLDTGLDTGLVARGSAIACFALGEDEVDAMLVLSPELANALIETACGGMPGVWSPRYLTPLDSALLEGLVRPLGHAIVPGLAFAGVETEPDFAMALARPGAAEIIDFDIRVETGRHAARLIIAKDLLPEEAPAALPAPEAAEVPAANTAMASQSLTVLLTARVASLSVPLSRLSDLTAGSTLLLGVPADQPVELLSGGRDGPVVAEAQIGRKGNRMALRISRRLPGFR